MQSLTSNDESVCVSMKTSRDQLLLYVSSTVKAYYNINPTIFITKDMSLPSSHFSQSTQMSTDDG